MDKPPSDATRKRKSEKADCAVCSKMPKSNEITRVGIANFVAQSSSTIDNSLTSCKLVASYLPLNRSQPSDNGSASGALWTISADQSTISRDYTDSKFIAIDRTSQPPIDCSGPNENAVGATLAIAQSGSRITQHFHDSQIHLTSIVPQQSTDARKPLNNTEEIKKFEVAVVRRNREVKRPRDVESVKRKNLADMRYSKYFERDEDRVLTDYQRERAFASKYLSSGNLLTYDKLIENIKKRDFKRLCIVGPAGCGKSTVISCLEEDLSMSDKLVVFLNFIDIDYDGKFSPYELFFQSLDCDNIIEGYNWLFKNQEKVIFLLDGLDQVLWTLKSGVPHVGKNSKCTAPEIISNLFGKRLLPDIQVIYTSREHALSALNGDSRPDKVISITGFSNDNVKYHFTKKLEDGEQLWNNMAASLKPLLSIPAFLTFTKYAYVRDPTNPPSYLTEIMENLFSSFDTSDHNRRENILTENEKKALGELSYHGLKEGKLTFKKEEFRNVGLDWNRILDFVIFVPGHGGKNRRLFDGHKVAIFLHQMIQEFFAGKRIIRMDFESFKNIVEQELTKGYWSVVTRFVTGLLLNKKSRPEASGISNYLEKQEILKKMLKSKYLRHGTHIPNVASTSLTLASIAETEDSDFIQSFVKTLFLRDCPIGISGMSSVSSVIRHCKHLESLHLDDCRLGNDEARLLWENIKDSDVKVDKLNVSYNKQLKDGFQYICKIAAKCNVRELDAYNCNLQGSQLSCLREMKPLQLRQLSLRGNETFNESTVDICTIVDNGGSLSLTLSLGNEDSELQLLEDELGAKKLGYLDLHGEYDEEASNEEDGGRSLSDASYASIGNIIADGGKLELRNFKISSAGLLSLRLALDKKKISKLCFNCCIFDTNIWKIIREIAKQQKVDELELKYCKFTAADKLSEMSVCVEEDKIFSLVLSKLDADCCEIISLIVTEWSVVDELSLSYCSITDDALKHLLVVCRGAKISELCFHQCIFDTNTWKIMQEIVKQCEVDELKLDECHLTPDCSVSVCVKEAKIAYLEFHATEFDADRCEFAALIVTERSVVDELILSNCSITDDALLLAMCRGANISSLKLSRNDFDVDCCEVIANIVTQCSVDDLTLSCWKITDARLERFLAKCKGAKISRLNLSKNDFNVDCCEVIANIVTQCSVDKLCLNSGKITDAGLERFLAKCKGAKISSLDLSKNNFNVDCCKVIANIVTQCSVDDLTLMSCKITDAGLKFFLAMWKGAKISRLDLSKNDFNVDCCEVIANIVMQCSVDKLCLKKCKINDAGLERFLAKCKGAKISRLDLSKNDFNVDCCEVIANIVTQCLVDKLNFSGCKITNAGLKRFLATCKEPKISSLNLSLNAFNVDCCEAIANIVTQCSVGELSLHDCLITDAGLKRFLAKCKRAKLDKLDVRENRLSHTAIKQIRESITVENLEAENQW